MQATNKLPMLGFSLVEVLVSLLVLTSISLALLKQQWQTHNFLQNVLFSLSSMENADNQAELALSDDACSQRVKRSADGLEHS